MTTGRQFGLIVIVTVVVSPAITQNITPVSQAATPQQTGAVLLNLSEPTFPQMAKIANVEGDVRVIVTVYPDGMPNAHIEVGIPLLNQAALDSAKQSRFGCNMCTSPSQYVLVYSFERTDGDCCSGLSSPVHVTQERPSMDEEGRPELHVIISTAGFCFCDPASEATKRARAAKCLYLWKCGRK